MFLGEPSLSHPPLLLFDHSVSSAITLLACGSSHPHHPFPFFHCFICFSCMFPFSWHMFISGMFFLSLFFLHMSCWSYVCVCFVCVCLFFNADIFLSVRWAQRGARAKIYLFWKRYSYSLLTWFKGLCHLCPATWCCSHKHLGSLL